MEETKMETGNLEGTTGQTEDTGEKVGAFQKFLDSLFPGKKEEKAEATTEEKTGAAETEEKEETKNTEKPEKFESFTRADMDAAIEEAKKKWEREKAEAERVKTLSPEEAAKEEEEKKTNRIKELETELLRKDLEGMAMKELEKDGYPVGLARLLDYSGKENMEKSLKEVTEIFKGSLEQAIMSKLKGKTPEGLGNAAVSENMLKDQIAMSIRGN